MNCIIIKWNNSIIERTKYVTIVFGATHMIVKSGVHSGYLVNFGPVWNRVLCPYCLLHNYKSFLKSGQIGFVIRSSKFRIIESILNNNCWCRWTKDSLTSVWIFYRRTELLVIANVVLPLILFTCNISSLHIVACTILIFCI